MRLAFKRLQYVGFYHTKVKYCKLFIKKYQLMISFSLDFNRWKNLLRRVSILF
jgi:hypothetical protein